MASTKSAPGEFIRVLLLEDDPDDSDLCIRKLKTSETAAAVDVARSSQEFMDYVRSNVYDLILTDYRLPDWNGLDALHWLRSLGRDTPVVLVTGTLGDELAIECIKAGVSDYVLKENLERLPMAVRRSLEEQELRQSRDRAEAERKNADQQLKLSEARYRSIIQSAPYGIYRVDPGGRITMANPACATLLGYDRCDKLIGRDVATDVYLNPIERQFIRNDASKAFPLGHEAKWKRKDGQTITVRLSGRQLQQDDELSGGFEFFVEDITEQRSLQKQFEQAQKMEAVGRLAGGVAHDFNNLLMVIRCYAHLLEEFDSDAQKVSRYATQIGDACLKGGYLTRQLLSFSRKQVIEPTFLDLSVVVKEMGRMLPQLLGEDIELVQLFDGQLGIVLADRNQIEQIIMNLAVNARDAMPKGGRLTIATRNVELHGIYDRRQEIDVPPGPYVSLVASDTGVGMTGETQRHIFEPFFTTKEVGKGTGLGLATVYGIVKQSRGFIWVYSEPNKGSIFTIHLPRVDAPPALEPPPKFKAVPTGTETILLAEDDVALRDVSHIYLESKGYTVLDAVNANEAMDICETYKKPIHLLITDVVMPGMGGVELAQNLLNWRPTLSVVLMSGYSERTLDLESIGMEARFLQKPFSLDALAILARSLLDKKQERRRQIQSAR